MKLEVVLFLTVFFNFADCVDNETVSYYVNLIETETSRAFSYPLPTDSTVFAEAGEHLDYGTFDYIIIGAGSSGAVIATRLSEIEENKILLLEAGGYETDFSDIPQMMLYLQGLEFNWNYNSTPQTTCCLGMINQECAYPRGKGLGGTSNINALMYVRGNKLDYDNWYKQGNPGWSYEEVLPYFKKSEDSHIDGDMGYHGEGGYLNVEYHKPNSQKFDAFIEANIELGRKVVDYNGKEQLGVARTQLNTIYGKRDSTGKAFLSKAKDRPNLTILPYSLVTKILITPKTRQAFGVQFSHSGKLLTAKAKKEIVISAGTINSPQLLMLSGIGPINHLNRMKIPIIKSLPVGSNFQDHATYFSLHFQTNYSEPVKRIEEYVVEYLKDFGPYTIPGNSQGLAFLQTNMSILPGLPDIEIILIPSNSARGIGQQLYHFTDKTHDSLHRGINYTNTFFLYVILLHPKSRGTVRLKSNNPFEYPLIDLRFLSDPKGEDIEILYQGILLALEIANTNAFKRLNATLVYPTVPECAHHKYLSKTYWYCQLRQLVMVMYHPVGTCKMGPKPSTSVVNHKLKVHGIKNLRVADASVIPNATSGHTNAPSIMIGEKVSDMIKKEHCLRT